MISNKKLHKSCWKKGHIPWNKNKIGWMSEKGKPGIRESNKQRTEEKAAHWLGDKVGYSGIHQWVERHLGKPIKCEICGKKSTKRGMIQWANKSGEYKRDLSDWMRICAKCHCKIDGWWKNRKKNSKGQFC